MTDDATLPSGTRFAFWDDTTQYRKTYHVDAHHPAASDDNPGTVDAPLRTINAAAARLQPREKAIIHAGVYRECIRPARGGTGPDAMIAYEAAPDAHVVVRGSEIWKPQARPSVGYSVPTSAGAVANQRPELLEVFHDSPAVRNLRPPLHAPILMADLPDVFTDGYNPFLVRNVYEYMPQLGNLGDAGFFQRVMRRRASVFVDGVPLCQVYRFRDLALVDGVFWVEEPGRRVHFRLRGDDDPARHQIEVTAREQVLAPNEFGLGYIRVSGIGFEHAADGVPVPQRAAVSAMRGHHWIIERCRVDWANAVGMDIGAQTWDAVMPEPAGGHIIRNNTIRHCGVCGLAGVLGVTHSLIENNTIEHIGGLNVERMWECAAVKLHQAEHCLFRGNTLRHIRNACGLWLDCSNADNRITRNVFADIETLSAGVYVEMTYDPNVVDHNVFWEIRAATDAAINWQQGGGSGVRGDCSEALVVTHNFFGCVRGYGVIFSLLQSDRQHQGRTGLCRANAAAHNVFYRCAHRIHLGRREENRSDHNIFDVADDTCSFQIAHPAPGCFQNLAGWQRYFNLDTHSAQTSLDAAFNAETGSLTWRATGDLPSHLRAATSPNDVAGPRRIPNGGLPGGSDTESSRPSDTV